MQITKTITQTDSPQGTIKTSQQFGMQDGLPHPNADGTKQAYLQSLAMGDALATERGLVDETLGGGGEGIQGEQGIKGEPGTDGTDGADGADGADGRDGRDGIVSPEDLASAVAAYMTANFTLANFILSNGNSMNALVPITAGEGSSVFAYYTVIDTSGKSQEVVRLGAQAAGGEMFAYASVIGTDGHTKKACTLGADNYGGAGVFENQVSAIGSDGNEVKFQIFGAQAAGGDMLTPNVKPIVSDILKSATGNASCESDGNVTVTFTIP